MKLEIGNWKLEIWGLHAVAPACVGMTKTDYFFLFTSLSASKTKRIFSSNLPYAYIWRSIMGKNGTTGRPVKHFDIGVLDLI